MPENTPDYLQVQQYRDGLRELFELKADRVITNGLPQNIPVLIETFFHYAQWRVRIFCQDVDPAIFDNERLLRECEQALDNGRRIAVCLLHIEPLLKPCRFLDLLARFPDQAFVHQAKGRARDVSSSFITMDDLAMRVAPGRVDSAGYAIMHLPETVRQWDLFFDDLFMDA